MQVFILWLHYGYGDNVIHGVYATQAAAEAAADLAAALPEWMPQQEWSIEAVEVQS